MNIIGHISDAQLSFYRTNHGNEIDIIVTHKNKTYAIECKATVAPSISKGFYKAVEDIQPDKQFIAAPVSKSYFMKKGIEVVSLSDLIQRLLSE